jgi:hypothetical protein
MPAIPKIAAKASKDGRKYSYYVAYGICSWFAMQISVNIAMNIGLMPIKGFTLPLGALISVNKFLPHNPTELKLWTLILCLYTRVFSIPRIKPRHSI